MSKVIAKIILGAKIVNTSNLLVASGNSEQFDFELVRNERDQLYIPASGFAGVLRKHFYTSLDNLGPLAIAAEQLWGTENSKEDNTIQSHIIFDDLLCTKESQIMVRDGVKIGNKGVAEEGSKYDYQFLEPGAEFKLNIEITIRQGFKMEDFIQLIKFICAEGINGNYSQGAFTSHGFGNVIWRNVNVLVFKFASDVNAWFSYLETGVINSKVIQQIVDFNHGLSIACKKIAYFELQVVLKSSLIIGSPDLREEGEEIDKVHLRTTGGRPVISAKSIRGPLRHRALRILNTIGNTNSQKNIESLFGFVRKAPLKEAGKGRIKIKEHVFQELNQLDEKQIQTRIKIDRFTQGTITGALFTTQPIWHKSENLKISLELENYKDEEIALLLLVFKDLMTGDLPLGGDKSIGRGVLIGKHLKVHCGDKHSLVLDVQSEDFDVKVESKGDCKIEIIEDLIKNKLKNYGNDN